MCEGVCGAYASFLPCPIRGSPATNCLKNIFLSFHESACFLLCRHTLTETRSVQPVAAYLLHSSSSSNLKPLLPEAQQDHLMSGTPFATLVYACLFPVRCELATPTNPLRKVMPLLFSSQMTYLSEELTRKYSDGFWFSIPVAGAGVSRGLRDCCYRGLLL